jgi:hypothetical protein
MRSQILFVLKVMVLSALGSAVIKYGGPYIPAIANHALTASDIDAIALAAISLPVGLFGLFLWWQK